MIKLKRAYDPPETADGTRVLVDGMWPRGVRKDELAVDGWMRDIAPSAGLRKWFAHDPGKWREFRARYADELDAKRELVEALKARSRAGTLTLVFAARDPEYNNAAALKAYLESR